MASLRPADASISRRDLLALVAGLVPAALLGLPVPAHAQDATVAAENSVAAVQQFSFDLLSEQMRELSQGLYESHPVTEGFIDGLNYDDYRKIRFNDKAARWQDEGSDFRLAAFHMGWLFPEPVRIFEVADGVATEMVFSTDDFEYLNDLKDRVPDHYALPGVAGFRLNAQLNRPDKWDEVAAFLGASYFRALGRGSAYGLSARGLALNTGTQKGEEFPRFSRFYMERDPNGGPTLTIYAALESPSVTGAYRFVIEPGAETLMDVTCRLYFRQDVIELGIAPMTSMFLFSEKNRAGWDDYRPNVHDSDGLRIERADGNVIWRPLNNPPRLTGSYFNETAPRSFGDPLIGEVEMPEDDTVEELPATLNLVDVMTEALALALPDFPRADGAELGEAIFTEPGVAPMRDEDTRPFAGLSSLKDALEKKDESGA